METMYRQPNWDPLIRLLSRKEYAGLAVLNDGGDFADGLIAYEGNWLGGETFVSFDKKAVSLVVKQGQQARLLT